MKIAHVTPVYPPYRGGMGAIAHAYTERLRALGHTVEVFQPKWKFGNAGFLSLKNLRRLKDFDVIHLHYPFYGGAEQILGTTPGVVPVVVTYHMDATADGIKGAFFRVHRRLIQPLILRRAKKILVSSLDYAKHSSLARFKHQDRIVELPFGVDVTRFHPVATEEEVALRVRLGIPSDTLVLLFVGGMDEAHAFKGMPVLLEALKQIDQPFHLIAVGDGSLRPRFEATAATFTHHAHLHFVGAVDPEELPVYYRAADIHVFPSTTCAEAFGLVALEAAASGIPTIALDLPGVRTVVKHNETGLVTTPGDVPELKMAIERLLNDAALREKLGAAARKRVVAEYASPMLMERLIQIYSAL